VLSFALAPPPPTPRQLTQRQSILPFAFFLTINVPVVFMARYVMILRGATSLRGHWKGWALKIETFLGPEMARAKRVPFGPKKVDMHDCMVCGGQNLSLVDAAALNLFQRLKASTDKR
jgi:hypothetical protein